MALYEEDELSVNDGNPVELYLFTFLNYHYSYTSSLHTIYQNIDGVDYAFVPEYIKRGDSLKLGDSGGSIETCTITVGRTNNIALLFQGAPPEQDSVKVEIWRQHGESVSNANIVRILRGTISQVRFFNSDVELTVTIEHVLNQDIPRGKLSYFCQNLIYDDKCNLDRNAYQLQCRVMGSQNNLNGLWIQSGDLLNRPSGYFTDGYMQMGNCFRGIKEHINDTIYINYPIMRSERQGTFYVWPGCQQLFNICHERFKNTDRFSGIPYQQPYDAFKHPTIKGGYWIDGNIVYRDTKGNIKTMNL